MTRRYLTFACYSLTWLALLWPTHLYSQITTGEIEGSVVDLNNESLPGAVIAVRNPDTGMSRTATSDGQGRYRLLGLPPGRYVLSTVHPGFLAHDRELVVNIGQTVRAKVVMRTISAPVEVVKVTGERPLLNNTTPEISTVVSGEEIQAYPLLNREFSDLAILAPGVRLAPTGQAFFVKKNGVYTPFTTGGTDGHNINISIDGADNNDNQVGQYLQGFPQDGIAEFEVIQDMPKAEYGRSTGPVINVITKSGTNDFSGSIFNLFRSEDTRTPSFSERLAGADKQDSDRYQFGVTVGGPIVKDRLFYFLAAERQDETTPIGLNPETTQYAGSEPSGFPIRIASPGSTFTQDFTRDLWTLKMNWNPTSDHLFWFRYSQDDFDSINDRGSSVIDPSNNIDARTRSWSASASWQWFLGPERMNELKISVIDSRLDWSDTSPAEVLLSSDRFELGQNENTPLLIDQHKVQLRDDFTWVVGTHTLKSGFEVIPIHLTSAFNFDGSLPILVFRDGIVPADTMVSGDSGTTPGTAANGVDDGVDILRFVSLFSNFASDVKWTQYGVYFQDDWSVNDRWRLHLGLRVDTETGLWSGDRGANRDFYECLADPDDNVKCGRDPATVNPPRNVPTFHNTFPRDPVNVSPRLGFVYKVGGGETDVIRGSWGLFYDSVFGNNVAIFNAVNNCPDCFPALFFPRSQLIAGTRLDLRVPPLPVDFTLNNLINDPRLRAWIRQVDASLGPATLDDFIPLGLVSPDYEPNYNSSYALGWGHAFTPHLVLDVNAVYRRGYHQYRLETLAGGATGRDAPWPAVTDPGTGVAAYDGLLPIAISDGATRYVSLQVGVKRRSGTFDFGASLNASLARGTQDNGATNFGGPGGSKQYQDGGNIEFTGGPIDSEWGRISGDQRLYAFLYGIYRLPRGFETAAQISWGTRVAVHPFAGVDLNGDGIGCPPSCSEYDGERGGGRGGDLFSINLRASKVFDTGKGTLLETFLDIFNLTNEDNFGTAVVQRQFRNVNGVIQRNPEYLSPFGSTLTPPRTAQLGLRFSF